MSKMLHAKQFFLLKILKQAGRLISTQTDRQISTQTDRQISTQTDRQTCQEN